MSSAVLTRLIPFSANLSRFVARYDLQRSGIHDCIRINQMFSFNDTCEWTEKIKSEMSILSSLNDKEVSSLIRFFEGFLSSTGPIFSMRKVSSERGT
jgi:hypothetical protein